MIRLEAVTVEPSRQESALDDVAIDQIIGPMSDFPRFEYGMRDIRRAGEVIAGDLRWSEESAPKIREAFQIANSWRNAHAYPMRSIRATLA